MITETEDFNDANQRTTIYRVLPIPVPLASALPFAWVGLLSIGTSVIITITFRLSMALTPPVLSGASS